MRICGIDPGASGAIAVLDTGLGTLEIFDTPTVVVKVGTSQKRRLVPALFASIIRTKNVGRAVLERVGAMPGQGVSSMFAFGHAAGVAEGVLAGLELQYEHLTPQAWQKVVRMPKGKDGSRARAIQLFPAYCRAFERVMDHGRSDAVLIAYASAILHGEL